MFLPLDSDISQFVLINCLVFLSHVLWEKDVNIYFQRNFQFTLRSSRTETLRAFLEEGAWARLACRAGVLLGLVHV